LLSAGFSLWSLFKTGLLLTNAVAILHKGRFLKPSACKRRRPAASHR
jgi:hypothetical protein